MGYKDRDLQRAFQRRFQHNRYLEWLLANGPCACGSWLFLRRDSIDGRPKREPSLWTLNQNSPRARREHARYRVVCEVCLTRANTPMRTHGATGYRYGCRCDVCRNANTVYRRELRHRTGRH